MGGEPGMVKKVMIVDDEPPICKGVKLILEGEGFEVVTALRGPEALDKLRKEKVGLVLIDVFMPGMDGLELSETIRKDPELKDLNLAFLTVASFGEIKKEDLRRLNVSDYIHKPFASAELVRRVRKILGE